MASFIVILFCENILLGCANNSIFIQKSNNMSETIPDTGMVDQYFLNAFLGPLVELLSSRRRSF